MCEYEVRCVCMWCGVCACGAVCVHAVRCVIVIRKVKQIVCDSMDMGFITCDL